MGRIFTFIKMEYYKWLRLLKMLGKLVKGQRRLHISQNIKIFAQKLGIEATFLTHETGIINEET